MTQTIDEAKEARKQVFIDTERKYLTDNYLRESIKNSVKGQQVFFDSKNANICEKTGDAPAKIIVSSRSTFQAARHYASQGYKTCVHNFASATSPGGGVIFGSAAQEESLCRCSTLHAALNWASMWDMFYNAHKKGLTEGTLTPLYNDDAIYTPDIVVFKDDSYNLLNECDWFKTDVITCAAPNLNIKSNTYSNYGGGTSMEISDADLLLLHYKRWNHILKIATEQSKCDALVLGAFGCGAFRNPPKIVAKAAKMAVENYIDHFKTIEFAVLHNPRTVENYNAFCEAFNKYTEGVENDV